MPVSKARIDMSLVEDSEKLVDTNDEWIVERIAIKERRLYFYEKPSFLEKKDNYVYNIIGTRY